MAELVAKDQSQGWASYLDEGEEILWQDRPDPGFHMTQEDYALAGFGLVFACFAAVWMFAAASSGSIFWVFGSIHFLVGLGLFVGGVYWNTYRRQHSWYALSSRRAFIATDLPWRGRRLKYWPITADSPIKLDFGPPDSVWFAIEMQRGRSRMHEVPIGFERIPDGRAVVRLIRRVQEGQG
ncbi:MAG: aspartate carbamoyltransferase catalytic subunit [Pseudomonadota bacterium]